MSISDPNQSSQNAKSPPNIFGNQAPSNIPRFSFGNLPPNTMPNFSFNSPTGTAGPVQQPVGSFTFTPSKSTPGQASPISNRVSDPPTPTAEQSMGVNQQEEEETNVPKSMEERSLLSKKLNTTLRDLNAVVVDRNDPNSPLHPLKTFQELNLKPELLKGECSTWRSCLTS